MAEQTKSIKELRNGLWSSDSRIVINTLQQVKNAGSTVLIPELAGLLRKDTGTEVTDHIAAILNNLKYQASADELVKVLREENDPEVISLLVSACWKNGLDYSAYVDDFIDLFLEYDYTTALDALTVIENATKNPDYEATRSRINRLKTNLDQTGENKRMLVYELIHILNHKLPQE